MLKSKKIPIEFITGIKKYKKAHKIKLAKAIKFTSTSTSNNSFVSQKIEYTPLRRLLTLLKLLKIGVKKISRRARLKINVLPTEILTRKPKDIRMGRGKGAPTDKVAITGDKIIMSLHNTPVNSFQSKKLFRACILKYHKLKVNSLEKW